MSDSYNSEQQENMISESFWGSLLLEWHTYNLRYMLMHNLQR